MYFDVHNNPLLWCLLSTAFFFMAITRQIGYLRLVFSSLHLLAMYIALTGCNIALIPYPDIWVTIVLGVTLHTSSLLFLRRSIVGPEHGTAQQRLQESFRIWINYRLLPLSDGKKQGSQRPSGRERVIFVARKCKRVLGLILVHVITTNTMSAVIRPLHVNMHDFSPSRQGILPPLTYRDITLRAIMCVQWIWATYAVFSLAHDVLGIFFVSITGRDMPLDWPPLFGSVLEAYTLRRFWGVFWHRLHVGVAKAAMPSFLHTTSGKTAKEGTGEGLMIIKGLRALFTFSVSAAYHAGVNRLVSGRAHFKEELKFFLCNFAVCLVESIIREVVGRKTSPQGNPPHGLKLLGYVWVFSIFFCIVPSWHYPKIYTADGR